MSATEKAHSESLNYFVSTIADAKFLRNNVPAQIWSFLDVFDLLERQSAQFPDEIAIGYADFVSGPEKKCSLTFLELFYGSLAASRLIAEQLGQNHYDRGKSPVNIGLVSTSSLDSLLTWLGLIRLGFAVLFIAPQIDASAVNRLCDSLKIETLFFDKSRGNLGEKDRHCLPIVNAQEIFLSPRSNGSLKSSAMPLHDVAYYVHTSGTSSSIPKPIPQHHRCMIAAIVGFPHSDRYATFSTTPIYHGGLPDCFRAWTSGAAVWFFPEGLVPVSGPNVLRALQMVKNSPAENVRPIRYFSSVPYILQLVADDEVGIDVLRQMDCVGVGGAALPTAVGDALVHQGVRLVSRLGSAECGFIMSSFRDFDTEKEWDYLRPVRGQTLFEFQERLRGLSELVVHPEWAGMNVSNTRDGSYRTSDLFEPHPARGGLWRYHSRADSQITLSNGKKFDPVPLENVLMTSTQLLKDILIFGSGRDYPGALLFCKDACEKTNEDVINSIWTVLESLNATSSTHSRIPRDMLIVVANGEDPDPLPKSSKGTVLRAKAETKFCHLMDKAYQGQDDLTDKNLEQSLQATVESQFAKVVGSRLDPHADLFKQGLDSISAIRIRKHLEERINVNGANPLPLNVIYEQGTVNKLVAYLHEYTRGVTDRSALVDSDPEETFEIMRNMVEKYGQYAASSPKAGQSSSDEQSVVLSGATGFLGAHILNTLRRTRTVKRVYCLVRDEDPESASERISNNLSHYGLEAMGSVSDTNVCDIVCVPWTFDHGCGGLSVQSRASLCNDPNITAIIHAAWPVNFSINLKAFEGHIAGVQKLIELAADLGARFTFISSTASVIKSHHSIIPEEISDHPSDASPLGYSQSKWVAEAVCGKAHEHYHQQGQPVKDPIQLLRVGQLCANGKGIWNMNEAYPLMLSTVAITNSLPVLPDEVLDWLPVETAAAAVVEAALLNGPDDPINTANLSGRKEKTESLPVFHIVNPHEKPAWSQLLEWIQQREVRKGNIVKRVSPRTWLDQIQTAIERQYPDHPCQRLIPLWTANYANQPEDRPAGQRRAFAIESTANRLQSMEAIQPLGEERLMAMWKWIKEQRFE